MSHTSTVAYSITEEITAVDNLVQEIADSSKQVNDKFEDLSSIADTLNNLAGQFKV